ncbi:MAG: GSCFA domain-containing protein [Salinivirgaceae bacterium]|nr:GSCFA domain-containing protein [Salinivirgaceae bacterium]
MNPNFRTTVTVKPSTKKINYQTPSLFIGSCFSENISLELDKIKLPVISNPYGVLYNPYSIQTALQHILNSYTLDDNDFTYINNQWNSLLHHSSFSNDNKTELKQTIENAQRKSQLFIKNASFLFITFGTAWVYKYKKTNRIVANCHKIPDREFTRFRLSVCDITDEYCTLIDTLLKQNPDLQIVFTISPIRHWKDGAIENQASKSILNVAIHQLCDIYETNVSYFPSYEIMMDDLRDYRFYSDNMLHPSPLAISYIFEKFKTSFLTKETVVTSDKIIKIIKATQHRPYNPHTEEYRQFCENQINEIKIIQNNIPSIDWSAELDIFKNNIGQL